MKRRQLMAEMELRIIIQRSARIISKPVCDSPADHVPHCIKIKMQIERDAVIETETFIVDGVAAKQTKTEGDDPSGLSPDKKTSAFWHGMGNAGEKFLGEYFEFQGRTLVHLKIERINFVDGRR